MSTLWYEQPASAWEEALPIGNGRLGGMVFGGVRRERIQLNEDTLWGGSPYTPANLNAHQHLGKLQALIQSGEYDEADRLGNSKFMGIPPRQPAYQTVGDLFIEMHGVPEVIPTRYRRELSLDKAEAKVEFEYDETHYVRRYVASPNHQVLAISITTSNPGALNLNVFISSPHSSTSTSFPNGTTLVLDGRNSPENGISPGLRFQMRCAISSINGNVHAAGDQLQVRDATEVTVLIAIATSYVRYDDVSGDPNALTTSTLSKCILLPFDVVAAQTAKDHGELFNRVALRLEDTLQAEKSTAQRLIDFAAGASDPGLISLYFQFGRYLLICSSRPGSQPANLQGIWNNSLDPGWGCGYTVNINTQMNYWLAEPAGLAEMVEPLIDLVNDLAQTGKSTAKEMYGAEGWVCHQSTDLWRATAPSVGARWALWPTGGAWLCRHLWDHYDYGRNHEYLEMIYPVLKEACQFFLSSMIEDPICGYMVTSPSCSPENVHGAKGSNTTLCAGPTMDTQIIRDLLRHTMRASEILCVDQTFRRDLIKLSSRLRPTLIATDGRIREWPEYLESVEPEPHHRHTSHLYGLYPSCQINHEKHPDLAKACDTTLDARGPPGTGWAAAWRLNLFARLRDGRKAWQMLMTLLSDMTYPNLFDVHPPQNKNYSMGTFQIDGNLGGAAGIIEMLVQSLEDTDDIILLPALPAELSSGSLRGVRLRGCWTIDIEWVNGKLVRVTLVSDLTGSRRVRYKGHSRIVHLERGDRATLVGEELSIATETL